MNASSSTIKGGQNSDIVRPYHNSSLAVASVVLMSGLSVCLCVWMGFWLRDYASLSSLAQMFIKNQARQPSKLTEAHPRHPEVLTLPPPPSLSTFAPLSSTTLSFYSSLPLDNRFHLLVRLSFPRLSLGGPWAHDSVTRDGAGGGWASHPAAVSTDTFTEREEARERRKGDLKEAREAGWKEIWESLRGKAP